MDSKGIPESSESAKQQSHEVRKRSVCLLRTALRCWPLLSPLSSINQPGKEAASYLEAMFLPFSRYLLTAFVAARFNDEAIARKLQGITFAPPPFDEFEYAHDLVRGLRQGFFTKFQDGDSALLNDMHFEKINGGIENLSLRRDLSLSTKKEILDAPLFLTPIPQGISAEEQLRIVNAHDRRTLYLARLLGTQKWQFWVAWYKGFVRGYPVSWNLQREIALIPDEEWQKGPERIAELIHEIEANKSSAPKASGGTEWRVIETERARSGQALKQHVQRLLKQAAAAEINAVGLAWQLTSALDEYCNENGLNQTPAELLPFEAVADVLARIGGSLAQARVNEDLRERLVDQLEAQIAELQVRIKLLEKELRESKAKEVKGLIRQNFYKGIGIQLSAVCITTAISGVAYFVAPEFAHDLTCHLGDQLSEQFGKPPQYFPQIGKD